MSRPIIITAALTGADNTPAKSPYVPISPAQIADEALAAAEAGAAIVHIHVRDPETKGPSRDPDLYAQVVEQIRSAKSDVLINLTMGPGARFIPDEADPARGGSGTTLSMPLDRVQHVLDLKPEICTLDVATFNFDEHAFVNIPRDLRIMARAVEEVGIKPELEVFELGHIRLARQLIEEGALSSPPMFQLCLGIPWAAPATPEAMIAMKALLPPDAIWAGFGIGRTEFPMVATAAVLGGHVRVGLEDNIYLGPGELARSNADLVRRAARIVEDLGFEPAAPDQARQTLQL